MPWTWSRARGRARIRAWAWTNCWIAHKISAINKLFWNLKKQRKCTTYADVLKSCINGHHFEWTLPKNVKGILKTLGRIRDLMTRKSCFKCHLKSKRLPVVPKPGYVTHLRQPNGRLSYGRLIRRDGAWWRRRHFSSYFIRPMLSVYK